jgi:indole-3-acetate monooxygenase
MLEKMRNLRAEIEEHAPVISARAGEIERKRHIPSDLVDTLKSIGVFRLCTPYSHGGLELDVPAVLEVITDLARIDGSVGWSAMIASGAALFASRLPRETYDRIYAAGSDVAIAGSAQPAGKAEAVPGGWRVSGRWPFASGCKHADWMVGFCVTTENGSPAAGTDGTPQVRGVILPAKYWQIEDTWHVAGLEGTGSHHIALKDALVSSDHFFDVDGEPCLPGRSIKRSGKRCPFCTVRGCRHR